MDDKKTSDQVAVTNELVCAVCFTSEVEVTVPTKEQVALIKELVERLSNQRKKVIQMHFLEKKKAQEIAKVMRLTTTRIHDIRRRALLELNGWYRAEVSSPQGDILRKDIMALQFSKSLRLSSMVGRLQRYFKVKTIRDLIHITKEEILEYKQMGKAAADAIESTLAEYGLVLAGPHTDLKDKESVRSGKIDKSQLSARLSNALSILGITTLQELSQMKKDLMRLKNTGKNTVQEARELLALHDRFFEDERPENKEK